MTKRRGSARNRAWRLETLEGRELLAGHGFAAGMADLARQGPPPLESVAMAQQQSDGVFARPPHHGFGSHDAAASRGTLLVADLSDDATGASASVTLHTHSHGDQTDTRFKVTVAGAAADATLDVTVGETKVGAITTDASGAGSLVLASNPTGDELPLPDDFPTDLAAGAAVSVGSLSGSLAAPTPPTPPAGGCHARGTTLSAALTATDSEATATARLQSITADDETSTRLAVTVAGAAPTATLDIVVDNVVVGQITTDADGAGAAVLSTDPSEGQQTWPANAPTVQAGSTITIGALSGTFAAAEHEHGPRGGRFR